VFHNAKDKEERFSAYNCRVELLEKSKLIRTQVRTVQYSTCCVVQITLICFYTCILASHAVIQISFILVLILPSSLPTLLIFPISIPSRLSSFPSILLFFISPSSHPSPHLSPHTISPIPSHPPGPRKPDCEHEGGPKENETSPETPRIHITGRGTGD
jgi:hypothetical protein